MIETIEVLAVIASALYGVLLATRKQMDVVGIFSVACILAFAGGTLRDLFLDRHPLFWIESDHYLLVVGGISIVGAIMTRTVERLERILAWPDALGLALFSLTGASFALDAGTSLLVASLLGVITGTFGGVVAQTVCNEVPSLFRAAPLHATCSFLGTWVYLLMQLFQVDETLSLVVGGLVIVVTRLFAVAADIQLPNAKSSDS